MRFLILGCNGMAGHTVSLYLKQQGYEVIGFARKESPFINTVVGDATDTGFLKKTVNEGAFNAIVNCVGLLNRQAEEKKDQAVFLNAYLPHFLETITTGTDTQVIHMSTDCVFSGKRGNYSEDDFRDGETFYDRSKALGELENDKDFTIRTSIIGPDLNPKGIGLLNWFMQQTESVNGFTNVKWSGITTLQLAKCIEEVAEKKLSGLCNVAPKESINKCALLGLCNDYLRADKLTINTKETPVLDKSLVSKRNLISVPDYNAMIEELATWIKSLIHLYPHYHIRKDYREKQ